MQIFCNTSAIRKELQLATSHFKWRRQHDDQPKELQEWIHKKHQPNNKQTNKILQNLLYVSSLDLFTLNSWADETEE